MDPLSHAIVGRFVTAAAGRAAGTARGCAAAAVLGALSPDVDVVLMPFGWDVYLRAHEVGTHALAGLVTTGLGSAGVVKVFARRAPFSLLAGAAIAGAASHVAADIASGARVRPLWPLADAVASMPLVAMADPWPIAILGAGAVAYWWLRERRRTVAALALCTLTLFLGLKGALLAAALRTFDDAVVGSGERIVEARWGSLTEWLVFDRDADTLRQWQVSARGDPPQLVLAWRADLDTPLVRASRRLDTVRNFLRVHDLAFAVEEPAGGSRRTVLWSDVRFCSPSVAPPDGEGRTIACGLWFGGTFAPDGRAITQEVRVGSWVQHRPPPPR
jgi:hypothetical protein